MAVTLSKDGETAVAEINVTRATIPRKKPLVGRWKRPRPGDRVRLELAVGRIVAAAEAYLLLRLARELKPVLLEEVAPPDPPDETTKKLRKAARSFPELVDLWKSQKTVDLALLSSWQAFMDLRQLRHVLVHRLGAWEPGLETDKPALADRIRRLGDDPDLYRGLVPLEDDELAHAVQVAFAVVSELEAP